MSVLVLGALHWDVVVDAPHLPVLGETLFGTSVDYRFGGKGGNQAVAAARLGAKVAMIGRVGRDAAGDACLKTLDDAGVDRSGVLQVDGATGMSVAITDTEGEYGAVIVSGANLENDGLAQVPGDSRLCLIQNEVPEHANLELARRLPDACRLILNIAPARELSDRLAARTDILIANAVEAVDLTGLRDPENAARDIAERGIETVIVTLGGDGLVMLHEGELHHEAAQPVPVISTHGAGDMFAGALAAALSGGKEMLAAVRFGQNAAAHLISRPISERNRPFDLAL